MKGSSMGNEGKKVKVHYVGTLDDGSKFDSSVDRGEPIEFVCATGQMIPGFDKAVAEMSVGETIDIHLEPMDAYGEYNPAFIQKVPVTEIPDGDQLPVGETVFMQRRGEAPIPVHILAMEDGIVSLDLNHTLAGKALNFEITLVEVMD